MGFATVAWAEPVRVPPSLAGLALVELDPALGVAVLQSRAGEFRTMKAGDAGPESAFRVTRIYKDRIEIEVPLPPPQAGARFWLWKGAPGAHAPRLEAVSRKAPESRARVPVTVEANPASIGGR